MFHKFGGKVFFYVLAILFFGLSVQNTWGFLNTILPDATPLFIGCMMIIFEGGFMGWLALVMHGAENIPRVVISFIMLLVTGAGVGIGAWFELSGEMHKGIATKIDPTILGYVPNVVLATYLATGAAILLYILANPHFFARMSHMNQHGHAPTNLRLEQVQTPGQRTISEQKPMQIAPAQQVPASNWRGKVGNFFAKQAAAWQANGEMITNSPEQEDEQPKQITEPSMLSTADYAAAQADYSMAPAKSQAHARRRATSNAPARGGRHPGDVGAILDALDAAQPGQSDAQLARQAGVAQSTVSRWRKALGN